MAGAVFQTKLGKRPPVSGGKKSPAPMSAPKKTPAPKKGY